MPPSKKTAKIINLKQARKQRQQAEKENAAATNREKFGLSKGEKQRDKLTVKKNVTYLDNHKLDDDIKND